MHRYRRCTQALPRHSLKRRRKDPDFLTLKIGQVPDCGSRGDGGRIDHKQSGSVEALVRTEGKHDLQNVRIGREPLSLRHRRNEAGRSHHFKSLVETHQKFRWNDLALDSAELHALGLPRDRAKLACRINLGLDATTRILIERSGKVLNEGVDLIVDGRNRNFHRISLVLRLRDAEREC